MDMCKEYYNLIYERKQKKEELFNINKRIKEIIAIKNNKIKCNRCEQYAYDVYNNENKNIIRGFIINNFIELSNTEDIIDTIYSYKYNNIVCDFCLKIIIFSLLKPNN
jgi:intergrase/recombinase